MGFFRAFGKLTQAVIQVAAVPLDIASDVLTLGGAITDDEAAISKRARKVAGKLEDAYDELDDDWF